MGGPLRDLERDVTALDRDGDCTTTSRYLDDLYRSFDGSRGGGEEFFFTGGARVLGLNAEAEEEEDSLEKKENETEEEFGRRVRKVNLLSLAQEFAELKKLDAQACPIDHARNSKRSGSLVRAGSDSPRGVSLDRSAGYSRRTQSRSPGRFAGHPGRRGGNLSVVGTRAVSKSPGRPGDMNEKTSDLPRNHEKFLEGSSSSASTSQDPSDLPVNEARRRGSSADLPANMRPGRQPQKLGNGSGSGAAGSSCEGGDKDEERDGDFDVYNIESAVPDDMSWDMVEKQIQERMRREVSDTSALSICLS